ncbi:translocation/assembly module TamB domain-containing protein [Ideonella oryzae]|uniref:Translocation/assembly module TamB domain-containing protein n=1 Tax=Ideonella oryzae TaxID=2937441 RepID=A0ABT1BLL0_9BURK|nr:translocation/assembly module TamB domain-containing protein [Ideonella oryzae]MCO5976789.1 translocation/assembly module TamB domain-containing protein [Ideonella oryzae]
MSDAPTDLPPPPTPGTVPRRWRRGLAIGAVVATAAGLLGLGSLGTWVWRSEAGLDWALAQVPGLTVTGAQGSLAGGRFQARQLHLSLSSGTLDIENLRLDGLRTQPGARPGNWLRLTVGQVAAQDLRWQSRPGQPPSPPPTNLGLPLDLDVARLTVARLEIDQLPALLDLQAQVALGAERGRQHSITLQHLATDRLSLQGQARIGTHGNLAVDARLQARSLPGNGGWMPWQASLQLQGPLQDLQLQARLDGQPPHANGPAPHAELQTQLMPFAAWPLGALSLQTQALDLASLSSQAPRTRLDAKVVLRSAGLDRPAEATLDIANHSPGRWDQGLLPLRSASLALAGTPQPLKTLTLTRLTLEWANAQGAAGRWTGEGRYRVEGGQGLADLTLQISQWQPAALDPRLPAMQLSGPLTVHADGLPSPGAASAGTPSPRLTLATELKGPLQTGAGNKLPASLLLDGQFARDAVTLRTLQLQAGEAQARLVGEARRQPSALWQWRLQGHLQDLDLRTWWPGEPDSEWRRAPQRLVMDLDTQGSLPETVPPEPMALWNALRGQLQLVVHPSVMAGVPVQGRLDIDKRGEQQQALADLQLDDGRLQAQWQGRLQAPEASTAQIDLKLPHLQSLAPWLRLSPALSAWAPQAGQLEAQARLSPSAQAPAWQGQAKLQGLQAGPLKLQQLTFNGQGRLDASSPLQASLQLDGLQQGERRITHLESRLGGSPRDHHLSLRADSSLRPPAWLERLAGNRGGGRAQLSAELDGHWQSDTDGGHWQGTLREALLRSADGSGQPWLALHGVQATLRRSATGELAQATLAPGALELPGGAALRWTQADWQAGSEAHPPHLLLKARLDPLTVAPLLAKAQPDMMWAGDLKLGASLDLAWDRQLSLDLVMERRSGDLSIDEDGLLSTPGRLPLELSDLRLALNAHEGTWQFTQGLAGRHLGVLGGALTAHTAPERLWPDEQASLQGSFNLQVASLGAWASWVPAGWRLGGNLQAQGLVNGRWGAPQVAGQVTGQGLSLRNALQGVELGEGVLKLRLEGSQAQLDTLKLRGGDGWIEATGQAELGEHPQARVGITAQHFRAIGRLDRRIVASGQATLQLDKDLLALDGQIGIDEGLIDLSRGDGPTLSDDVVIAGSQTSNGNQDTNGNTPKRTSRLNLALDLGKQLRLKGRGIDTSLQGTLKLTNPQGRLALNGTVRTVRGTYKAYGQNLRIERGDIMFSGPMDDPRLDIYAARPNLDVNVGVAITGTALNPRVRLASDTDMSDTERLSWLVMGRAPDNLGEADTALLQRAALALLAGDGESPTDKVLGAIGLTDFGMRHDTSTTSSGATVQSTIFNVGKQLSNRWYVGYERSINAATGNWQLIYRAAQRFTLRAQSGEDNAVDAIWSWRWD